MEALGRRAHHRDMARENPKSKNRAKTFIRQWRKHRGMKLEGSAERLELEAGFPYSAGQLSRVERGDFPYSQDLLEALAIIYRCTPADLLMRDPSEPEGIWSIYDALRPQEQVQLIEIGKTIKRTGTEG